MGNLYSEFASKVTTETGMKAVYRYCSVEEFETRAERDEVRNKIRGLGQWLAVAPARKAYPGTVKMAM
jgi:hypothetical protein